MSSSVQKLFLQLSLIDKITEPSRTVCKSVESVRQAWKFAAREFAYSGALMSGTVSSLHNLSLPAREFSKALGEVESLGVAKEELDKLAQASRDFTAEFGGDAVEIARSAYDIQSAIPGLGKGALAAFTTQGALLAKATKADAATITAYQGTMYSIFKREAETIGQAKWVDQLTGKTAKAVQMFKTTGEAMSAAFTNLGSTAQLSGVGIDEQMAVLGTLQSTMGGENAGTAYKAMLVNITKAGKVLGMNFTDAEGRMLPIVEILEKIKERTGDANLKAADAAALVSAFGKQGAQAVMNLLSKTDELKGSIGEINKVESSLNAAEMAQKMVDPLDKFNSQLQSLKIVFGQAVLPVVNGLLWVATLLMKPLIWALDNIPPFRWAITGVTVAAVLLVSALTGMKIILGITTLVKNFSNSFRLLNAICYKTLGISLKQIWAWTVQKTVMLAEKSATLACALAQKVMSLSLWHTTAAQWGLNTALLACPITWIVIAVAALVAELVLLVVYWDEITAALRKFYDACGPFAPLVRTVMRTLLGPVFAVADAIMSLGDAWDDLKSFFDRVADYATRIFTGLGEFFSSWWEGIVSPIRKVWEFFSGASGETVAGVNSAEPVLPASAGRGRSADVPAGGVRSSTVNRTTNYGGVTINTSSAPRAGELEEWVLLAGG